MHDAGLDGHQHAGREWHRLPLAGDRECPAACDALNRDWHGRVVRGECAAVAQGDLDQLAPRSGEQRHDLLVRSRRDIDQQGDDGHGVLSDGNVLCGEARRGVRIGGGRQTRAEHHRDRHRDTCDERVTTHTAASGFSMTPPVRPAQ